MFIAAGFLFGLGLVVGSFLNVVIYRTIHGESPAKGRSRCRSCKSQIAWYDNIPLVSFVILRGKCRNCQTPISWQYPAVELMTGVLFVWWYVIGLSFFRLTQAPLTVVQPVFWLVVGILLLIIFVTDWLYQIIPDYANGALAFLAILYRLYLAMSGAMQWRDFWMSMVMGLMLMLFLGGLWALTKGRGMGFGDVKFAFAMGVLLGWPRGVVAMFLGFVLGAVAGLIMIGLGHKKLRAKIAFGPFLVLGTVLALIWGGPMWEWYWNLLL